MDKTIPVCAFDDRVQVCFVYNCDSCLYSRKCSDCALFPCLLTFESSDYADKKARDLRCFRWSLDDVRS